MMRQRFTAVLLFALMLTLVAACSKSSDPPASSSGGGGVTVPAAPTGLAAVFNPNGSTIVSWTSVSGAASYNIYWANATGVTKGTGTKIAGVTSPYIYMCNVNPTTLFYIVTALNSAGESADSTEVSSFCDA